MKQLDRLLLKSFVGPFVVSFAIALFAFLMQYLWVYIDEIIGKGAGMLLIAEMVGYLSVSMMPTALPVGVLIASVMTMGSLAEHYELAAMKSAGVPLLRIMMPLMLAGLLIAGFSFVCSNYLIPVANLKAKTRLYDIRKQKPSLSLEEGAFNDDFQGFAIRIANKLEDDKSLEGVMLYKQGGTLRGRIEAVSAERGVMDVTPDDRYFILELEDGYQYQEPEAETRNGKRTHPFVRTKFATYRKTFDLSEFEIDQTDDSAFENHHAMLNVSQLEAAIDSIRRTMESRKDRLAIETGRFITPLKKLDQRKLDSLEQIKQDSIKLAADLALAENDDAEAVDAPVADSAVATAERSAAKSITRRINQSPRVEERQRVRDRSGAGGNSAVANNNLGDYRRYLATQPNYKQVSYIDRAVQSARTLKSYADGAKRRLDSQRDSLVQHIYERHYKWSSALACFIFLFIGAPMGAIIRKGGFGYPILVSIIFFTLFIILTIASKKLTQSYTLQPGFAAWLPTLVIFPIGVVLTYSAMNDIKFSIAERLGRSKAWLWLVSQLRKKDDEAKDVAPPVA